MVDRGARYPLRIDPFVQQGQKLVGTGAVGEADRGSSVAVSADGNTALVAGWVDNGRRGAAWVFTRLGSTWTQQGPKLVGTGAVGAAEQGHSVALSADGNTALVGGPQDNDVGGPGATWVFTRSGSTWTQQGPKLVGTGAVGAFQGSSVSLSTDGNTALIGGPLDNGSFGAAWVFTRSGSTWSQQGPKLVGSGAVPTQIWGDYQGDSVALSGDGSTALIGGRYDNSWTGATWVFTRSGSTWTQQGPKLVGTGAVGGGGYGAAQGSALALSADGNTALVGGDNDSGNWTGATWVFTRAGSTWTQQGPKLVGTGAVNPALQGSSLSLSGGGNTALIGGPWDNGRTGATWVFTRSGSTWIQQGPKLVGTGAVGAADQGAVALSADGSTALVGGGGDNNGAGAAWVFVPEQPPTIDSLLPGSGITGSSVTITGSGLSYASSVKFGSLQASFKVVSDTRIDATVPDGAVAGPVSVTTTLGTATSAQSFTPTLSITGFSPTSGPVGTVVHIKGIGFTPGSAVKFNGTAASVKYISAGEVRATVPAGASIGPITLSTAAGTVRGRGNYKLTPSSPPTITSLSPTSGLTGSQVTITGTYLSGASSVKFGSLAANFHLLPPTQITATVPNGASTSKITVTTAAGTATSTQSFAPTVSITGYFPTSGPGGTVVDIKGVGFTPAATVKFNGTPATTVTYISAGEVKATVPAGATTGPITIATAAGTVRGRGNYTITTSTAIPGRRPIATLAITTPLAA